MTDESHPTCSKCIIKLVQKHTIIISLKSIIKENCIKEISKTNHIEDIKNTLIEERKYCDSLGLNFLSKPEKDKIKEIKE